MGYDDEDIDLFKVLMIMKYIKVVIIVTFKF